MTRVIKVITEGPQGPPGAVGSATLVALTDVTGTAGNGKAPVSDGAGHFALTDIATQAELDTEAATRASADSALDTRVDALEVAPPAHVHSGADITSGTVADARIAATIARDTEVSAAVAAEATARDAAIATAVAGLINGAPGALDTLKELADAINDDASFAASVTTALAAKQPLDATLTGFAALAIAANKLPYGTGVDTFGLADFTAFARTILDDADAATMLSTLGVSAFIQTLLDDGSASTARSTLGLVIGTDVQAHDADLDTYAGITPTAIAQSILAAANAAAVKTLLSLVSSDVGLGSVTNDAQLKASALDVDGTLAANSDTRVPSQKAVKTYADALIAANDAMVFKGVIDASANPNYPAANRGDTYKISVAGKIGGASGTNVEVGDLILCITDGTSAGNQATVGTSWTVVQTNIDGAVIGPASSTNGAIATYSGTSGKLVQDSAVAISTDGTFAANSDAKVPTEKAAKAYADAVTAAATHAAASKATPVDADEMPLVDSAASNVLKRLTWANLKATLKTYFDTLYVPVGGASVRLAAANVTTAVQVVSTTTETDILNFTLAANSLGANGVLRTVLVGDRLWNNNLADTMRIRVYFGGTLVLDWGAVAPGTVLNAVRTPWKYVLEIANLNATNSQWIDLFGSLVENSGNNTGIGGLFNDVIGRRGGGGLLTSAAAAAIDTTASAVVRVSVQWSASSANDAWRLNHAYAELLT